MAPQSRSPSPSHPSPPTASGNNVETLNTPSSCIDDVDSNRDREGERGREPEGVGEGGNEKEGEEKEDDEQKAMLFALGDSDVKGRVRRKISPFSASGQVQPGSLSTSPQKATPLEHLHAFSDTTTFSSSEEYCQEDALNSRPRKGSEPPPSLVALFERDMGSSRRTHKQRSNEEGAQHPKQHSFDCSHLTTPQAQGSPRHRRRMKSPVPSDREKDREKAMTRAPSHPHLHQTTSTPHFPQVLSTQPLTKARSIQQLGMDSPSNLEEGPNQRSYSGDKEDLKLLNTRQKCRQDVVGKTPSSESLLTNVSSVASLKEKCEVERTVATEAHTVREDQVTAQRQMSVDSVPLRYTASPAKSYSDMWRRNSTQIGVRRDEAGGGRGNVRPRSMVETSTLRPHHSVEFNPTPSTLVAQMFWTAVSLLESDFEAEFSMALRLISKVVRYWVWSWCSFT